MHIRGRILTLAVIPIFLLARQPLPGQGQGNTKPGGDRAVDQTAPMGIPATAVNQPDANGSGNEEWAWNILTTALDDRKHPDIRIQALAALGLLGSNQRSMKMILDTLNDPDVDLRTAAVLAAGETKSPSVTGDLRRMLDDKEPQVAFAAATTLWKMNDRSGEDILVAVVDGDRPAGAGVVSGTMHTMNRDLHNPTELARLGAMQGASMLLGPFGMGIAAYEYLHKNGGDAARVSAVEEIAENHTAPIRAKLIAALADKDVGVRTAAAKALAGYHEADVAPALANDFADPKSPVRLTAAASYLVSTGTVAPPPTANPKTSTKKAAHKS